MKCYDEFETKLNNHKAKAEELVATLMPSENALEHNVRLGMEKVIITLGLFNDGSSLPPRMEIEVSVEGVSIRQYSLSHMSIQNMQMIGEMASSLETIVLDLEQMAREIKADRELCKTQAKIARAVRREQHQLRKPGAEFEVKGSIRWNPVVGLKIWSPNCIYEVLENKNDRQLVVSIEGSSTVFVIEKRTLKDGNHFFMGKND